MPEVAAADGVALLHHAIDAAIEDVHQAQETFERGYVDPALRRRLSRDMTKAFKAEQACLAALRASAHKANVRAAWHALHKARERMQPLLDETFALLDASAARERALAADICAVADGVLDVLAARTPVTWKRFTMLADHEYTGGIAHVVRVRFPELTLWSLPMAAHELGHFIAPNLGRVGILQRGDRPVQRLLDAAGEPRSPEEPPNEARRWHLEEQIADAFAAYTVGPCFGFAAVVLRFAPDTSHFDAFARHPNDLRRVRMIVRMLELQAGPGRLYGNAVDRLRALWDHSLAALGAEELPTEMRDDADVRAQELFDLLRKQVPGALYAGWSQAVTLAPRLGVPLDDAALRAVQDPWDLVNAAWWRRIEQPADPEALRTAAGHALDGCRRLLAEREDA